MGIQSPEIFARYVQLMVPLLVIAAFFRFLGWHRLSHTLFVCILAPPILSVVLTPILGDHPDAIVVVILAVIGLALLRLVATLLIGKEAADIMTGSLAASLILGLFRAPFRLIRKLFQSFRS